MSVGQELLPSLLSLQPAISVSSCSDPKEFGKNALTDGREDTCWSSGEGSKQWIRVRFGQPVVPSRLILTLQGGFTSRCMTVQLLHEDSLVQEETFHPEDSNGSQEFVMTENRRCNQVRLVFDEASDLFGRIIVYRLDVLGSVAQ